ncbi:MAG: glycoside hydrolase family 88 protein [Spirochaetaceae bacterium]|nr:glycoside hydrolase family 88 protein [Spirochaetaceae bacterium]
MRDLHGISESDLLAAATASALRRYPVGSAAWNYENGLMLYSLLENSVCLQGHAFDAEVKRRLDTTLEADGSIRTYRMEDFNLDQINMGKVAFVLWEETGDPRYENTVNLLVRQLALQPRTPSGSFWHKKIYPDQVWLDGLYMFGPFLAAYARRVGREDLLEDTIAQVKRVRDTMRDGRTGLYYHGRDESKRMAWADPATGCSPEFWGRAQGWLAMALVDMLEIIPEKNAAAASLRAMLSDLAASLIRCQQPSGLWCQLPAKPGLKGNYFEASASCMIAYVLLKGARKGWLSGDACLAAGKKAIRGIENCLVAADERDEIHLSGICKVAGLGGKPYRDGSADYYIREPVVSDDFKGMGPFLLAMGEASRISAPPPCS